MPLARSGATGRFLLPTSICRATRQSSLISSRPFPSKRVCVSRFPCLRLTTPTRSRLCKSTAFSPPCFLTACALQKPHATVGTPFALGLPLGCNARAVRLTSFRPCVSGSHPSCLPSIAELRLPTIYEPRQSASYAAHFDTTTPLNVAVGCDAHFSQLARAASALDSASTPITSAAAPVAVTASLCPPPNAGTNVAADLPAPHTQCTRLHLPAPAQPSP
eukprot:6175265-Pleurochrysis_carterae.AAC.1